MFRDLRADEIEVRVAMAKKKGVSLLLYKDARVDQNILDETVGAYNWMRSHSRDNANCTVSLWDDKKQQWISKEDTGVESYTEKEKGLASDSFKRACFNWGIGRELYTAPFIWIEAKDCVKLEQDGNRWVCKDPFSVESITIKDKRITEIKIKNLKSKQIVYSYSNGNQANLQKQSYDIPDDLPDRAILRTQLIKRLAELGRDSGEFSESHNLNTKSTAVDFWRCLKELENR